MGPRIVGSGVHVADTLQEWVEETVPREREVPPVDGFNLAYAIPPGSFADFTSYVVPAITARGAYQSSYAPGTLRNKLLGRGDRLADEHRGAGYRVGRGKLDDRRPPVDRAVVVGLDGRPTRGGPIALAPQSLPESGETTP